MSDDLTLEDFDIMLGFIPRQPYAEWLKIASGAWNHYGEAATPILAKRWPEEKAGEYGEKFKNRLKDIGIGSVIRQAKLEGWRPPQRAQKAAKAAKVKTDFTHPHTTDGLAEMKKLLQDRKFNFDVEPARPHPILMLEGKTISTPGNITNIQAPAKAGKSAVFGAIVGAIFNGNTAGADTLGFTADNVEGKAVVHFDTEQSRFDHDQLVRRALARTQKERPPTWFFSYCLTDLPLATRRQVFDYAIESHSFENRGLFAVLIDGVADVCGDPNDAEESNALVDHLHSLAIRFNCAVLTVLHENPGSGDAGKMRGHLGSQLERKAETPLRLAKDAATGITTIWSDRARHCHIPKNEGTCFAWSDKMGMHVSMGKASELKASEKRTKFLAEAEAAFDGAQSLASTDLMERVMKAADVKERAAKARLATYLAEGITIQTQSGKYVLNNQ